jgi:hypothetical protein
VSSIHHLVKDSILAAANPGVSQRRRAAAGISPGGRPMARRNQSRAATAVAAVIAMAVLVGGCGSATATLPARSGETRQASPPPRSGETGQPAANVLPSASPSLAAGTLEQPIDLASLALDERSIEPTAVIETEIGPYSVIQTEGSLWVGSPDGLVRIDPDTNTAGFIDHEHGAKVVGRGVNVWRAAYLDDRLTRYDGRSGKVLKRVTVPAPLGMSASGPLWVALHNSGEIVQVNESTGEVIRRVTVATEGASGTGEVMPIGDDVWVVSSDDQSIVQVDARSGRVGRQVDFGMPVCEQAAFTASAIWACLNTGDDEKPLVQRLDTRTSTLGPVYRFEGSPASAFTVGDLTWLPTSHGLVGVDAASGVPKRFLRIAIDDVVARYAIKAFGSIWVVCRDGQVLRFARSDFG